MIRLLLYLVVGGLLSCAKEPLFTSLPATAQAALHQGDSGASAPLVVVLPKKNSGQLTLQIGTANQASATGTDQTGKKAQGAANGGQLLEEHRGPPLWVLAVGALLSAAAGAWIHRALFA